MTAEEGLSAADLMLRHPMTVGALLVAVLLQPVLLGEMAAFARRSAPFGRAALTYRHRGLGPPASLAQIVLGLGLAFLLPGLFAEPSASALVALPLGMLLYLLAAFDLRAYWLPDRITLPLAAVGLVSAPDRLAALSGLLLWGAAPAVTAFLYQRIRGVAGLGFGDVKLCAAIGAWLGPIGAAFGIAAATLVAIAVALAISRGDRQTLARLRLPLGLFLSLGFWVVWIGMPP